jgi:hypothetical protein
MSLFVFTWTLWLTSVDWLLGSVSTVACIFPIKTLYSTEGDVKGGVALMLQYIEIQFLRIEAWSRESITNNRPENGIVDAGKSSSASARKV